MSRLSTAEEFKAANEKLIETICEFHDAVMKTKTAVALTADKLLRCMVLLVKIADMMERREDDEVH